MSGFESVMERLGAVPKGSTPKAVIEEGGEPGYYQTDPMSTLVRGITNFQRTQQMEGEKKQKKVKDKVDMYKTLREAGYDPKRAFESVMKGDMVEPSQEDTTLAKPKAQSNYSLLKTRILEKIANGESLTSGEQKIYDDILTRDKAKGTKQPGSSEINNILNPEKPVKPEKPEKPVKSEKSDKDEMIAVISPTGVKGKIPKANLEKALKKGYKRQ